MSIASKGNELSRLTSAGEARSGRRRELINRFFYAVCLSITSIATITTASAVCVCVAPLAF